jgi:hypothetical protein
MTNKKDEAIGQVDGGKKEFEKTIWSVHVGTQTLYKVHLEGRTRLDNMSQDENKKVGAVLEEAIAEVAKILEKRTTQHEVAPAKEQITKIEATEPENVEEKEDDPKTDETEVTTKKQTTKHKSAEKKEEIQDGFETDEEANKDSVITKNKDAKKDSSTKSFWDRLK